MENHDKLVDNIYSQFNALQLGTHNNIAPKVFQFFVEKTCNRCNFWSMQFNIFYFRLHVLLTLTRFQKSKSKYLIRLKN